MPRFDHPELTVDPRTLDVAPPLRAALPAMSEPVEQPVVTAPLDEPLVAVEHPNIAVIDAYHRAGWSAARSGTWIRAGAFDRLVAAVEQLPSGFGLSVFDAWRPLELQAEIYEAAYAAPGLPPGFVAPPSADPERPPPHLTGGTVDLTLSYEGRSLALGTGFDAFTPEAAATAFEDSPGMVRDLRRLLYWSMRSAGFVVLNQEWWHFEYGTRRWAALTGAPPLYGPALL
ncbi:MAG: D-alanyl-D-alanine dipeptidase [Acidimicrobiia bacterium]|nr:D-alanyl-D-alanine dipeptidase [Acidimicrobiia bacterium]